MENQNGDSGSHPNEGKTTMAGTCTLNGRQTNTTSGIDMVPNRCIRGGPGRPRKFWSDMVTEALQNMEMTWTDCREVADDSNVEKP